MTTPSDIDDELPAEVDFSSGVRGQFFQHEARVSLPADDADDQDAAPTGPTRSPPY